MKKFTLVASMLCMTALTTFADSKFGNWTLNGSENVVNGGVYSVMAGSDIAAYESSMSSQIATTSDGGQVVASFGTTSATLAKFGTTSWTKTIGGTVSSVIADNDGGVYVAGSYAKTITLGDKTLEGYDDGEGSKWSTFFAHFDKDGNVTAANSVVPTIDQALKDQDINGVYSVVSCNPEQIALVDGKIYVALTFTSVISNADKSESLTAGSYTGYGLASTKTLTIATLNADLGVDHFLFVLSGAKNAKLSSHIQSSKFAVSGNHLYIASQIYGYTNEGFYLQLENQNAVTFDLGTEVNFGTAKGYVLTDINLADKSFTYKPYVGKYDWQVDCSEERSIKSVNVVGDNILVAGDFTGLNSFDLTKSATGGSDVFVASFKKSDCSLNWIAMDGKDEGKKTDYDPWVNNMTSSAIVGDKMYVSGAAGYTSAYSSARYLNGASLYAVDLNNGTMEAISANEYVTGLAAGTTNNQIYVSSFEGGKTALNLGLYTIGGGSGISGVKAEKVSDTKIYNLQGQRLSAPVKGQINIVNGKKVMF